MNFSRDSSSLIPKKRTKRGSDHLSCQVGETLLSFKSAFTGFPGAGNMKEGGSNFFCLKEFYQMESESFLISVLGEYQDTEKRAIIQAQGRPAINRSMALNRVGGHAWQRGILFVRERTSFS